MTDELKIFHQCPECGYVVDNLQFRYARFDYPCPFCKLKTLSSFVIMTPDELAQGHTRTDLDAL